MRASHFESKKIKIGEEGIKIMSYFPDLKGLWCFRVERKFDSYCSEIYSGVISSHLQVGCKSAWYPSAKVMLYSLEPGPIGITLHPIVLTQMPPKLFYLFI